MRKDISVAAGLREGRGKNEARRLRASGMIPSVLYGPGGDPIPVAVSPKEVKKILQSASGHNTIFDLDVQNQGKTPVMVVDWQLDPVKSTLLHVDLKRIDLNKRITVKIPVHLKGEARGVKQQGGLLEVVTREVEVECLPNEIPEQFEVDITDLAVNQGVRASELPMTGSMKLVSPAETMLVHIVTLKAEADTAAEGGAATAEPEVIKKGKKEEEGAAAKGGDAKAGAPKKK